MHHVVCLTVAEKNQTMAAENKKAVDGGPMPLLTFPPNIGILPD